MDPDSDSLESDGTSIFVCQSKLQESCLNPDVDKDDDSGIFHDDGVTLSDAGSEFNLFWSFEDDEKSLTDKSYEDCFEVVDYKECSLQRLWDMIKEMQSHPGTGYVSFGRSEFKDGEDLQSMLNVTNTFLVKPVGSNETDEFIGFLSIGQTKFTRSSSRHFADLIAGITLEGFNHEGILEFILTFGTAFAREAKFAGVTFETFSVNKISLEICRSMGFHEIARIPKTSYIADHGLTENVVMLQELDENLCNALPSYGETGDCVPEYDKQFSNMHQSLDYLPYQCETRSGLQLTIDYMKIEEMPILFELLTNCAKSGRGYTHSDIEDIEDLVESILTDSGYTCLGIYTKSSEDPIGTLVFCANRWVRSSTAELADVWIVLKPEYEGQGIGGVVSELWASFAGDLGYAGLLVDVFSNNTGMMKILQKKLGYQQIGMLPKCGYLPGNGWTDAALFYSDTTPGQLSGR